MKSQERRRVITIFEKYFRCFLDRKRTWSRNKKYLFPARIKRVFLKELLGYELSKLDLYLKNYWGLR